MAHPGIRVDQGRMSYAGPEDVACDVCTSRKLKAQKSCLQCLISFCEEHLQPHFLPAFEKHRLVEPSKTLQENICSRHDVVMKMFCRTDQQPICDLCSVDQHKGHDTVSAAAERTERQRELQGSRQNIQQRIQHRERDVKLLQQEVEAINGSADRAVEDSEKICTELIRQVRSQQQTEVSRVRELQEKLEQEITELKRKDKELEKLSHTQDRHQFLQDYPSVSQLREPPDSSRISKRPRRNFEGVTAAVSELRDKLQDILRGTGTNISETVTDVDVLLSEPEPRTRAEFLRYSRDITLDPNTANRQLLLFDGNTRVTMTELQPTASHPDRFTHYWQVLSKESLTGRCYWEVEMSGRVYVAVAYKTLRRAGKSDESAIGHNDKSWALEFVKDRHTFRHNNTCTPVPGPRASRVGVYLDHSAGTLSFYRVSETMTLLHRVQTTFTEPLHAGFRFKVSFQFVEFSAVLCRLK